MNESQKVVTYPVSDVRSLIKNSRNGFATTFSLFELPDILKLNDSLYLVRSDKRGPKDDCYYTVTPNDCSCKEHTYDRESRCSHMKKYFPTEEKESLRPGKSESWPEGANGPVLPAEVICNICGQRYKKSHIENIIAEDKNKDRIVLIFVCPMCGYTTNSYVYD